MPHQISLQLQHSSHSYRKPCFHPNTANLALTFQTAFQLLKNGCTHLQFQLSQTTLWKTRQKLLKSMGSARGIAHLEQFLQLQIHTADLRSLANSRIRSMHPVPHSMHCPMIRPNCRPTLVMFLAMTGPPTKNHRPATTCQFRHTHSHS